VVRGRNTSPCQDCLRSSDKNVSRQDTIQQFSGKSGILALSWQKTFGKERGWSPDIVNFQDSHGHGKSLKILEK